MAAVAGSHQQQRQGLAPPFYQSPHTISDKRKCKVAAAAVQCESHPQAKIKTLMFGRGL